MRLDEIYSSMVHGEAGRASVASKLFTAKTPARTLKFGKYNLIKNLPTVEMSYTDAVKNKYISSTTQQNVQHLLDRGFKFDKTYFVAKQATTWTWQYTPGSTIPTQVPVTTTGIAAIIIMGQDPNNEEVAYVRKGMGNMQPALLYFKDRYGAAGEVLTRYPDKAGNLPSLTELLDAAVSSGSKFTINKDGSVDINGSLNIRDTISKGFIKYNTTLLKNTKYNRVSGSFRCEGTMDLKNIPNEVTNMYLPDVTSLKDFPTKKLEKLHIDIKDGTNLVLENLPPGIRELTLSGGDCTIDFKGLPRDVHLLQIYNINITNLMNFPQNFDGTLELRYLHGLNSLMELGNIGGNLEIHLCPQITEKELLKAGVGSLVKGDITFTAPGSMREEKLDKRLYNREYRDAIEQGSKEAGINLDF